MGKMILIILGMGFLTSCMRSADRATLFDTAYQINEERQEEIIPSLKTRDRW
ncbi:MAG: hypothetical protein KGI80_06085 [Verrucomicrobiota bacterium]|nr:hypothetical protein [Verrucomicrobiota bacterium]